MTNDTSEIKEVNLNNVTYLFDTNILIDYLKGYQSASDIIEQSLPAKISIITWIEVLVGTTADNRQATEDFLSEFEIIDLDKTIATQAINVRKQHKIKLPDAVIWATAKHYGYILVTRNTKDFSNEETDVLIPYHI